MIAKKALFTYGYSWQDAMAVSTMATAIAILKANKDAKDVEMLRNTGALQEGSLAPAEAGRPVD